jgi:hypothetical protein
MSFESFDVSLDASGMNGLQEGNNNEPGQYLTTPTKPLLL